MGAQVRANAAIYKHGVFEYTLTMRRLELSPGRSPDSRKRVRRMRERIVLQSRCVMLSALEALRLLMLVTLRPEATRAVPV